MCTKNNKQKNSTESEQKEAVGLMGWLGAFLFFDCIYLSLFKGFVYKTTIFAFIFKRTNCRINNLQPWLTTTWAFFFRNILGDIRLTGGFVCIQCY